MYKMKNCCKWGEMKLCLHSLENLNSLTANPYSVITDTTEMGNIALSITWVCK